MPSSLQLCPAETKHSDGRRDKFIIVLQDKVFLLLLSAAVVPFFTELLTSLVAQLWP